MQGSDCLVGSVATLSCIPVILQIVINWLLVFSATVAVFFVLLSGVKFITSGGDAKQVEGARKTLTYAIIGLVVVILSFTIINFIGNATGAKCILNFGFDTCK